MNILFFAGSAEVPSYTLSLISYIGARTRDLGHQPTVWDPIAIPLPICDPAYHHRPNLYPDENAQWLFQNVRQADAIVLGSPLYHGSYSGVLKNAVDLLWYDAFKDKVVGLVSHASQAMGAYTPCTDLQTVARTLYGTCIQTQVATAKSDYRLVNGELTLANDDIRSRVDRFVEELVFVTLALAQARRATR